MSVGTSAFRQARRLSYACVALGLLVAAAPLAVPTGDVSGTWTGTAKLATSDGQSKVLELRLDLAEKAGVLTGTAAPSPAQRFALQAGKSEGTAVAFKVALPAKAFSFALQRVSPNRLEGELVSEDRQAKGTVVLTRMWAVPAPTNG